MKKLIALQYCSVLDDWPGGSVNCQSATASFSAVVASSIPIGVEFSIMSETVFQQFLAVARWFVLCTSVSLSCKTVQVRN